MDVEGSSQEEVSTVQVHWTPNLGCNLRIDLNTGVPEYSNYLRSTSWVTRRALRTVGDGGEVMSHVRRYEEQYPGCHILQQNLVWKYDFLRCFLGCLEEAELSTVAAEIRDVSHLSFNHGSWAVKTSKNMSRILRHDDRTVLGKYMAMGQYPVLSRGPPPPSVTNPCRAGFVSNPCRAALLGHLQYY